MDLTRCHLDRTAMAAICFDRLKSWDHPTHVRGMAMERPAPGSGQTTEAAAELEFSDVLRSARFPAGWFALPSAAIGCLVLFTLLH
jgi:hypothetical protein